MIQERPYIDPALIIPIAAISSCSFASPKSLPVSVKIRVYPWSSFVFRILRLKSVQSV